MYFVLTLLAIAVSSDLTRSLFVRLTPSRSFLHAHDLLNPPRLPVQITEAEILSNVYGSPRYEHFLSGLGYLLSFADCDESNTFLGGLSSTGEDGPFTYAWHDDFMQGEVGFAPTPIQLKTFNFSEIFIMKSKFIKIKLIKYLVLHNFRFTNQEFLYHLNSI